MLSFKTGFLLFLALTLNALPAFSKPSRSKPDSLLITTSDSHWMVSYPHRNRDGLYRGEYQFINGYKPHVFFDNNLYKAKILKLYRYKNFLGESIASYNIKFYKINQNNIVVCTVNIQQNKGKITAKSFSDACYFEETYIHKPKTEMKLHLFLM